MPQTDLPGKSGQIPPLLAPVPSPPWPLFLSLTDFQLPSYEDPRMTSGPLDDTRSPPHLRTLTSSLLCSTPMPWPVTHSRSHGRGPKLSRRPMPQALQSQGGLALVPLCPTQPVAGPAAGWPQVLPNTMPVSPSCHESCGPLPACSNRHRAGRR